MMRDGANTVLQKREQAMRHDLVMGLVALAMVVGCDNGPKKAVPVVIEGVPTCEFDGERGTNRLQEPLMLSLQGSDSSANRTYTGFIDDLTRSAEAQARDRTLQVFDSGTYTLKVGRCGKVAPQATVISCDNPTWVTEQEVRLTTDGPNTVKLAEPLQGACFY